MQKNSCKKHNFTLLELAVAMSIFAILMLILMQIFGATQTVWRSTSAKATSYESGRTLLTLLSNAFENALYSTEGKHFYLKEDAAGNASEFWLPTTNTMANSNSAMEQYYVLINNGDLFNLKFAYKEGNSAKFREEETPVADLSSQDQYLLQENIAELKIIPMKKVSNGMITAIEKFQSSEISNNYYANLPDVVIITLKLVDDDEKAINATDKTPYTREFKRIVYIKANQSI